MTAHLLVIYPTPGDPDTFERAYREQHLPYARPRLRGATGIVTRRVVATPGGPLAFYMISDVAFPSLEVLQACAASEGGREALAHASTISSGGAPVVLCVTDLASERPGQASFVIRQAKPAEFEPLGQLMVGVYADLEGFPSKTEQPRYYEMLANIGRMTEKPETQLLVAVDGDRLLGGLVYFSDMAQYGSGGTATKETGASGFRLLAVAPEARGLGVGKALAKKCIDLARERGHDQVIIHTTDAMKIAWGMYENLGFRRSPDLDFMQEKLQVYGFRLKL
jgi:uncharacterized protein (TIGR02118 family)